VKDARAAQDTQSYVDSARTHAEKGDLKAAEIQLRNALRQAPQDARLHAMLAQIYLKQGELASAEREARSARDLKGDEADYLLTLAEALRGQGKDADISLQIKPGTRPPELESKVRTILAMAAARLNDPAKAETLLREAVAVDPAPGPKLILARQLLGSKTEEAERLADEVLAADPRSGEAIVIKGEILTIHQDIDGAMQRFTEALAIDPNNVNARLNRANVNLSRGDYDNTDKDLAFVLKAEPQSVQANYLRALENVKKRDFAAADKILDRLIPVFGNMPQGFYVLAVTKYGLGQYGAASDAIAKYVARVPESAAGARLAAAVALRRKAPDVAIQYLTGYLARAKPDAATLSVLWRYVCCYGRLASCGYQGRWRWR
jgi:Tfp pilus assembly protein PilF